MFLDSIIKVGGLPDIDIDKMRRISTTSSNYRQILKMYWLCFANPPVRSPENLRLAFSTYGKIFYRHYEIKQKLLDHFDGNTPGQSGEIEQIKSVAGDILNDEIDNFSNIKFNLSGATSTDIEREFDLTKFDSRNRFKEQYSKLFLSLLMDIEEDPKSRTLYNYSISMREVRANKESIDRAYVAELLENTMREILDSLTKGVPYRSRNIQQKIVDAVYHYLVTRGEGKDLTNSQAAKEIYLQYLIRDKGGKLYKPAEDADNPIDSIAHEVKRIRKENGI